MPPIFVLSLAIVVAVIVGVRLLPGVPWRGAAARISGAGAVISLTGVAGLGLHCAAMFNRPLVEAIPGTAIVIRQINGLSLASILWYVVPSLLLLIGLRRQHPAVQVVLAGLLIVVGVTMFDGGPLALHLASIFAFVVVLSGVVSLLILPPWDRGQTSRA
jgi:hypothetical protein